MEHQRREDEQVVRECGRSRALADKYGAEALRYYLMSDIVTGKDADFSEERLVSRFNGDLANSLGNLLNRTLNMAAAISRRESVLYKFRSTLASILQQAMRSSQRASCSLIRRHGLRLHAFRNPWKILGLART